MNQTGQIAFLASITGGVAGNGIFLVSNATLTAVAVEGQAAPYIGGGSFEVLRDPSINDAGEVAFVDSTKPQGRFGSGSISKGVFLSSGTVSLVTAANGYFHRPSLVRTVNGNRILLVSGSKLVVWSGGTLTQLLKKGDTSPAGGVYSFIGHQVVGSQGHFAFVSNLNGSSAKAGIFLGTINF